MNRIFVLSLVLALVASLACTSCNKEEDMYNQYMQDYYEYLDSLQNQEKADLLAYLAKENITVKPTESGLYKIILKEGEGTATANGHKASVHYIGMLLNGKEFDNSYKRGKPFEATPGRLIKGFDEGISTMKKGEKCRLIFTSDLGYGAQGAGSDIPPFSTLIFDVELLEIL